MDLVPEHPLNAVLVWDLRNYEAGSRLWPLCVPPVVPEQFLRCSIEHCNASGHNCCQRVINAVADEECIIDVFVYVVKF